MLHFIYFLQYKLCKVRKIIVGTKGIPHLVTHDARTIRYPDPLIKANDTIRIDIETGKITDHVKFDTGRFDRLNALVCLLKKPFPTCFHCPPQATCAW